MYNRFSMLVLLVGGLLAGCSTGGTLHNQAMMHGFNALQHKNVAWDKPAARRSFKHMVELGSNAVVLIPFLEQDSPTSMVVRRSDSVIMTQLQAAIGYAHEYGLKIILKPQILVRNSWAGEIDHDQPQQWHAWFDSYSRHLLEYARFASDQRVDALVIGTELSRAANQVDWSSLIKQVRSVYAGQVTYAAHNVDGVERFRHWHELDAVSLTLYPSLGLSGEREEMQRHVDAAVQQLKLAVEHIDRPLWVLEVGMPSARGASSKPWAWQGLKYAKVDLLIQKNALEIWLHALDKPWVDAVFIWAWYSDYNAGGRQNADYTPQHKPAEFVIRRYWKS
jgi:hypothetical protein